MWESFGAPEISPAGVCPGRQNKTSFKNLLFAQYESVNTLVFVIKTKKQTKHPELITPRLKSIWLSCSSCSLTFSPQQDLVSSL